MRSVVRFAYLAKPRPVQSMEGIIPRDCETDFLGDEDGRFLQAVGRDRTGIWVVPVVTDGHSSGAHNTAGRVGDYRGAAKSRFNSVATNLPGGPGLSWPYHHHPLRFGHVHVGGFPWPELAGTSQKVLASRRERRQP